MKTCMFLCFHVLIYRKRACVCVFSILVLIFPTCNGKLHVYYILYCPVISSYVRTQSPGKALPSMAVIMCCSSIPGCMTCRTMLRLARFFITKVGSLNTSWAVHRNRGLDYLQRLLLLGIFICVVYSLTSTTLFRVAEHFGCYATALISGTIPDLNIHSQLSFRNITRGDRIGLQKIGGRGRQNYSHYFCFGNGNFRLPRGRQMPPP